MKQSTEASKVAVIREDSSHKSRSLKSSGLRASLHGHGYEGANENRGKKLADDGLRYGKRAGERSDWENIAEADGGQSGKTEINELGSELVDIRWRGDKVKRSGM